jgi:5S rRNA maturation endonuclease (ribonuclease M5)
MTLEAVLARLKSVRRNGSGWQARCPAHEDRTPSLSISEREGKILVHCHASCSQEAVCAALKIEARELFLPNGDSGPKRAKQKIVATYDYCDEKGTLLYQKVRYEPKTFSQRRRNEKGEWTWKLDGVRRVLYRLPEVIANEDVLIVEGEKDADTAKEKLNMCGTTGGSTADKWLDEYTVTLKDKNCVVIADVDEPGRKKARAIASSLYGTAATVRLCEMPSAKDLSEWVEHGGTREQFLAFVNALPAWKPEVVDGARLLDQVAAYIRRFVSLSESQARIAALWVVHTHVFDAADSTPYLAITSAEKQSGKTRLLEVFLTLVVNPWFTGRVTAAVLTRKIDADQPALLLDESDAAFGGEKEYAEALRGVLNTGHRRGGTASCCVGQGANISFKDFSTFCPKAVAGIGKLPDTVADRAIPIRLKRAAQDEKVERFRRRDVESEATRLRAQIEAWCSGIIPVLRDARPELPDELTDRQQDGAEPLLAIADAAGGDWPRALRQSLIALCAEARAADSSIGVQLLTDIRQVFDGRGVDRMASADLAAALCEIETSPWAELSHGKPITPGKLARLLSAHEIKPHSVRIGDKTPKGYQREDFEDAWARYLRTSGVSSVYPPSESATAATTLISEEIGRKQNATQDRAVADQNSQEPAPNGPCCGVALSDARTGETRVVEVEV